MPHLPNPAVEILNTLSAGDLPAVVSQIQQLFYYQHIN
jgi:hypothetical protein